MRITVTDKSGCPGRCGRAWSPSLARVSRRIAPAVLAIIALGATAAGPAQARSDSIRAYSTAACVLAKHQTMYLGYYNRQRGNHSILRLSWQPDLCKDQAGRYDVEEPTLEVIGSGTVDGVGLSLRAPEHTRRGVTYRGDVRECIPLGAGYKGISFSGTGCRTVARATITVTKEGRGVRVIYEAKRLRWASFNYGKWGWSNRLI
jgi:hypothetical protein